MGNCGAKNNSKSKTKISDTSHTNTETPKLFNASGDTLVWQINCRRSNMATLDLNSMVAEYYRRRSTSLQVSNLAKLDLCICVQEPQFKKKIPDLNTNLQQFFTSIPGKKTRAAVLAPIGNNMMLVPSISTPDVAVCIRKSQGERTLLVVSAYLDINCPITNDEILSLLEYRAKIDADIVICADTNAHSPLWGCKTSNARGNELEELIFEKGLTIINVGELPTFEGGMGKSIIDLTICNDRFVKNILDWEVIPGVIQSDHNLVKFSVRYKEQKDYKKTYFFNKANWCKFQELMRTADKDRPMPQFWSTRDLERQYKAFLKDVTSAMRRSIPYGKPKHRSHEARFWNQELDSQRAKLRTAFRKWSKKRGDESLKGKYNQLRFEYKKNIDKAKRSAICERVKNLENVKDMSTFVKICQGLDNKTLGMLTKPNGSDTETISETLEHLMETHFPGSEVADDSWKTALAKLTVNDTKKKISDYFKTVVTPSKVIKAFSRFKDNKAAGPDDIKPVVLKNLPRSSVDRITSIYRASLELQHMPTDWLRSKAIFIPKPGKETYKIAKSFRPISLSSFLLKGLERVVGWHLEDSTLVDKPLSEWQHGFRKDKSTETAIIEVINYIESAKYRGQFCVAILLDIQGAFDNVNADRAKETLKNHRFPSWFINWYGTFLGRRFTETELKGEKITSRLKRGTPQGDVLSTTVWNVIYDPLLTEINNSTACKAFGFADDGIILMQGIFLKDILKECQKALNKALKWGKSNGLTFNASKTEILIFTDKRKYTIPHKLKMDGKEIEFSENARYLGVTLDNKLSWNDHLEGKIKAAKRKLMVIKNAINSYCGPSNKLLEWAYRGIIIPSLSYGAAAWGHKLTSETIITKLRRLNRLAMLLIGKGIYRSTPTRAMEIILNYKPLHLLLRDAAYRSVIRVSRIKLSWDGIGFGEKRGSLFKLKKEIIEITDRTKFLETGNKGGNYNLDLDGGGANKAPDQFGGRLVVHAKKRDDFWETMVVMETGEKTDYSETYLLPKAEKDYRAQLLALLDCLNRIKNWNLPETIVIFVKKSVASALKNPESKIILVQDTVKAIKNLAGTNVCVRILKKCNNLLGRINGQRAKTTGTLYGPDSPNFDYKSINQHLMNKLLKDWNKQWKTYPEARQTKIWLPEVTIIDEIKVKDPKMIGILIQIITGHGPFGYHLKHGAGPDFDTTCTFCEEEEVETASHLVLECPALERERNRCWPNGQKVVEILTAAQIDQLVDFALNAIIPNWL